MSYDVEWIRKEFPALSLRDNGLARIYLDNPAGTQVPRRVIERTTECLVQCNANLGGYFSTSRQAGELVDLAHSAMATFLNADSPREIIFGQNSTTLTFHLSRSIGRTLVAGDEIIVTRADHDTNIAPWLMLAEDLDLRVRWLELDPESCALDLSQLDGVLNDRTKLVAVGYASNVTGTVNDVAEIIRRSKAAGAMVFVDAVQYAPHHAIDVQALGCDFLVCSAYKFYGPHQGVLWGAAGVLEELQSYKVRPAGSGLPGKFETGTLSHEGIAGTLGAVEHFGWIGSTFGAGESPASDSGPGLRRNICAAFEVLQDHENALTWQLIDSLNQFESVRILGVSDPIHAATRVPTVSFVSERTDPDTIARTLAEQNVFVWSGHNYALELYRALGYEEDGGGEDRTGTIQHPAGDRPAAGVTHAVTLKGATPGSARAPASSVPSSVATGFQFRVSHP